MTATVDAPTILVTGADGQVGWELCRTLAPLGRVVALRRSDVDLADHARLRETVRGLRPALIVNAAAYTAVDRAESERGLAFAVNATAAGVLADEAARTGATVVHYSTDYVFDGASDRPYVEDDPPSPISVYGASKLAGDEAVAASGAPHLILRASWVYAARGRNFMRTMLRLAHEREELRVVADQCGAPTPARLIAEVTAQVLARHATGASFELPTESWGSYHLAASGVTSWYEFACAILALDPRRESQRCRAVIPIATSDFPTPVRRPAYSVLGTAKLQRTWGLRMPDWRSQLELVMREYGEPATGRTGGAAH
ncbi:MAG: dTDP-4-dehydrorhamnose reductase [Gemmatimonadaceae bacterium]